MFGSTKRVAWRVLAGMSAVMAAAVSGSEVFAQTIHVDAAPTHTTNTIVPTEALGAGIDRLPYGASDKLLTDENIEKWKKE